MTLRLDVAVRSTCSPSAGTPGSMSAGSMPVTGRGRCRQDSGIAPRTARRRPYACSTTSPRGVPAPEVAELGPGDDLLVHRRPQVSRWRGLLGRVGVLGLEVGDDGRVVRGPQPLVLVDDGVAVVRALGVYRARGRRLGGGHPGRLVRISSGVPRDAVPRAPRDRRRGEVAGTVTQLADVMAGCWREALVGLTVGMPPARAVT